jgi:hypothetical protein
VTTGLPGGEAGDGGLFDITEVSRADLPVTGLRSRPTADLAAVDAALAGDGYAWLAGLLPAPQAPACEACGTPMRLPGGAPVLWACPSCYPAEAA